MFEENRSKGTKVRARKRSADGRTDGQTDGRTTDGHSKFGGYDIKPRHFLCGGVLKGTRLSERYILCFSHPLVYCMLNTLMYQLLVLIKNKRFIAFTCTHDERFSEVSPVSCATSLLFSPDLA